MSVCAPSMSYMHAWFESSPIHRPLAGPPAGHGDAVPRSDPAGGHQGGRLHRQRRSGEAWDGRGEELR